MLVLAIGLNGAAQFALGVCSSYIHNANAYFSIDFINRDFCAKTRIWRHII